MFQPLVASFVQVMERSILTHTDTGNLVPYTVDRRKRYATCSGVAWLRNDLLAVVNLYGQHLRIYRFQPDAAIGSSAFTLLHELKQGLSYPETVAAAPDGSMLAIAHSMSREHGISLHRLDGVDHSPSARSDMLRLGTVHGVCFSPDSRHLAFAEICGKGYAEVVNMASGKTTCLLTNKLLPLKPKGIAISRDGRYMAIVSARNVLPGRQRGASPCVIAVYRYHEHEGLVDEMPVAEYAYAKHRTSAMEACAFTPNQADDVYELLAVDQANDQILAFEFNSREKRIGYRGVLSEDTAFPHGIDISPDGRFVATANYGDDTLRILSRAGDGPREKDEGPGRAGYDGLKDTRSWLRPMAGSFRMRLSRNWFPGQAPADPGRPTLLLCGHCANKRIFGAERSLLDLLEAFGSMSWNVIVTLPSANNKRYLNQIRGLCQGVHVFNYKPFGHNSPDENSVAMFAGIIAEHDISFVHVNTTSLIEPPLAARRMKIKSALHARELITGDRYMQGVFGMPPEMLLSRLSGLTDYVIANSHATLSVFAGRAVTCLLHNAIDDEQFDLPNRFGDQIRFGMVSSNLPKKGLADFVEIARRCASLLPNAEFVVIGPYNRDVAKYMLDRVFGKLPGNLRFLGYMDASRDAIAEMNVLLSLSHVPESFGRTVAEALAARRPVIAYRLGALPELIDDGDNGFLIPCRDIDAAVDRIARFCGNPGLIETMGNRGRAAIAKRFSKSLFATNLAHLYEKMWQGGDGLASTGGGIEGDTPA